MFNSPLRYPGGKNKLARFIASACKKNNITGHYVEPYAGGASVALYLLFNEYVKEITINDLDRSLYALWHSIIHHTKEFCNLIENTDVDVRNWKRLKEIQNETDPDTLKLGFSTFFLNRTNRSGILNGGIIGGKNQAGKYKIGCRFNKTNLIDRIKRIASYEKSINISCMDAKDLICQMQKQKCDNMLYYFDPPYFVKGPSLYMNYYTKDDHAIMASVIKKIKDAKWIVSYDNVPEIRMIYKSYQRRKFPIAYTARDVRYQEEVLFFSNGMVIPPVMR